MSDLPPVTIPHPHIHVSDDVLAGSPVLKGTRVPVRRLWAWYRKGVTAETFIKRYPALGPARVLAALAFAHDNQDLMTADLAREAAVLQAQEKYDVPRPRQLKLPFDR